VPGLAEATAPARGALVTGAEAREARLWRGALRHELLEILVNAVIVVAITVGESGLNDLLGPRLPPGLDVALVLGMASLVLCTPSLVLLVMSGVALSRLLAQGLGARFPWLDARVLRGTLLTGGGFLLLLFLLVVFLPLVLTRFGAYGTPLLLVGGALALVLGYFLWRMLHEFQRGMTGLVRRTLALAARGGATEGVPLVRPAASRGTVAEPVRSRIEHARVPHSSRVVGRRLGECGLPERAGVTILGIERRGRWIDNPGPAELLQAGDHVVLLGSEEQRAQAIRIIAERERKHGD
jgi:hypothetical protein